MSEIIQIMCPVCESELNVDTENLIVGVVKRGDNDEE